MYVGARKSVLILFTAALVVLGTALVAAPSASAETAEQSSDPTPTVQAASDGSTLAANTESEASAEAADVDKMVNVVSDTTEDTTTWANPDGSFTTQEATGPVRIADTSAAAGWRDLDYTLQRSSDGSISPKSGYAPITLSGAATAAQVAQTGVVTIKNADGTSVRFGWNGALPAPTLDGDTATYKDVAPNLDIVIQMTSTGFEQFFVLTAPPTASELDLVLPLSAPSLSASDSKTGGVVFSNAASKVVGNIAPGFLWDSRVDTVSGLPSDEVQLGISATSRTLSVTSPSSYFDDPNIEYPVTIDPTYSTGSSGLAGDTFVRYDFQTTTYASSNELQVGTYNGGTSISRSYLNISSSAWRGTNITGATLQLYEFHSYSCTAATMTAEAAGTATSTTDWGSQPTRNTSYEDTTTSTRGYSSSCPAGNISLDVKKIITHLATKTTASSVGIALVASETSNAGWKRFYSSNETADRPEITITYYHTPNTPAAPTFSSPLRACGTATAPVYVNNTQDLTLASTVSSADSGTSLLDTATITQETMLGGSLVPATPAWSTTETSQASVTASPAPTVNMTIPAGTLSDGSYYAVSARSSVTSAPTEVSAYSTKCFFQVVNHAPPIPTVILDGSPPTAVGASTQVKFSAAATTVPEVFAYWWTDTYVTGEGASVPTGGAPNPASLPADGSGAAEVRYATAIAPTGGATTQSTGDITVAPPDVNATLWVAVFDAAGNVSTDPLATSSHAAGLPFSSLSADPKVDYNHGHEWDVSSLSTPLPATVSDLNTSVGSGLANGAALGPQSPASALAFVSANMTGYGAQPVLSFSGSASDTAAASHQVIDTTQAFSVSAFVQPTSVSTGVAETAVAQAATGSGSAAFTLGMNSTGHYAFCIRPQTTAGSATCAVDSATASTTSPQFIEGVWDPANQQVRLLETGSIVPVAVNWYKLPPGEISATGPLLIGSDFVSGSDTNEWKGLVTDPSIFPGIIDTTESSRLSSALPV